MKNKILLIVATHGDEKIGLEIVKILKNKKLGRYFDFLIGNPKALKKNLRFIEVDLNRSYPGKKSSLLYEERTAFKNLSFAKEYQYVLDIHEASQGINDFIIIPKERLPKLFPVNLINLGTILIWPNPKGPMSQMLENAVELEFGMKNRSRKTVIKAAERVVRQFIKSIYLTRRKENKQKLYYVYGKLFLKDFIGPIEKLRDFRKTMVNGETFRPLLVGQYLRNGIICYKMRLHKP
jgi:succinylglutamate desuccinylase